MRIAIEKKIERYKLKPKDTLESLATYFGIDISYLRDFHNIYASTEELISINIPKTLDFIYIESRFEEKVNADKTKIELESGQVLHLKPPKTTTNYGVSYTITENNDENEIKFETSVTFLKQTGSFYLFEISRNPEQYINTEIANSFLDEMASQCGQTLYPLQIITDASGSWLDINNHDDIIARWGATRKKLEEYYEGDWCKNYLDETESMITSKENVVNALQNDWFLASFFSGIFINYYMEGEKYEKLANKTIAFPIIPHISPVTYSGLIQIEKYLDEYNIGQIEFNGTLTDERSKEDFINLANHPYYTIEEGGTVAIGELKVKYFLDSKNWIESLYLSCEIELETTKKVQVVISKLSD